jgi:hypothetical protein
MSMSIIFIGIKNGVEIIGFSQQIENRKQIIT